MPYFPKALLAANNLSDVALASTARTNLGVAGVLRNERLAKTSDYTLTNADKGKTIALSGKLTLTVPSSATFDADFQCVALNEDTWTSGRAQTVTISGLDTRFLYPTVSFDLRISNGAWTRTPNFQRVRVASPVLNFDATLGNSANDGLATGAGGAIDTIANAYYRAATYFDWSAAPQSILTLQGASGNVDPGAHLSNRGEVGAQGGAAILIDGGGGRIENEASHHLNCAVQYQNIEFRTGLSLDYHATVELLSGVSFGAGALIQLASGTTLLAAGYTISAGSTNHLVNSGGLYNNSGAITFSASVAFSDKFLLTVAGETVFGAAPILGGHTVTGQAYEIDGSAYVTSAGTIPGSIAGVINGGTLNGVGAIKPVSEGGTGAASASGARTNLGLGSIATQDASAVAITGGTIAGATINNTAIGGTTAAAGAFTTLKAKTSDSNTTLAGSSGQFTFELRNTDTTDNNWTGLLFWQGTGSAGADLSAGIFAKNTNHAGGGELHFLTNGASSRGHIGPSGGLVWGAATGDDLGAGNINVHGGVYKDNTAYTNPDYVFEWFYTGKIEQFAKSPGAEGYAGLMPLDKLREHTRKQLRLPGIVENPTDIFDRADMALRLIEECTLYILDLHERIAALEARRTE